MPRLVNRHAFQAQDELWDEILNLASAVESMLVQAVQILCEGRVELASGIKAQETRVDHWEVHIEEQCIRTLALYQPVASDLRRTISALRLSAELERIGDLAVKIARRSKRFSRNSPAYPIPPSLVQLATVVTEAVRGITSALAANDADSARVSSSAEAEIDRRFRQVSDELKDSLRAHPDQVTPILRLLNSARNLERVGDHIVSMADAIIFIREGRTLRKVGS